MIGTGLDALLDHVVVRAVAAEPRIRMPSWTPEEDQFIIEHLGWLTEEEIARELGRTVVAVHLRWYRDLGVRGPSKAPDVVTAYMAAKLLGIDGHKVAGWCDQGLIPHRIMAGGRRIRLIQRVTFLRWVCNPHNWMYFDRKRVADPHIKRLLQLKARRWGDEWWSTRQAADYRGVDTKVIQQQIRMGRLPSAFHVSVSYGGRDKGGIWSYWFVLRSEVKILKIPTGKGVPGLSRAFTPAADRWILKARDQLGMEFAAIGKTMKIGRYHPASRTNKVIMWRYHRLKKERTS